MAKCLKYHFSAGDSRNELPAYMEKDGFMVPCVPANFERLGILVRVDAAPEAGKTITQSHGELIDGQWLEVIDEQKTPDEIAVAAKLARTKFTKLEIREAFKALDKEADLNALLTGNSTFNTYWLEAGEIDLEHTVTVQALASFTAAEIEALKLEI